MKKRIFTIFMIIMITTFGTQALATENNDWTSEEPSTSIETITESGEEAVNEEKNEELSGASEEVLGAVTKKDKRIAELSDKYNDKTIGTVAYYLELVRYYSTPIFFIFLTIGGFNFFIIGNKKLDKKEQGYGWITACIIGWVIFQCIPLVFALFVI